MPCRNAWRGLLPNFPISPVPISADESRSSLALVAIVRIAAMILFSFTVPQFFSNQCDHHACFDWLLSAKALIQAAIARPISSGESSWT